MTSPLREGTPEQFAALRRTLSSAGYTTAGVCRRTNIDSIYAFRTIQEHRPAPESIDDALGLLIHVFMDGRPVSRALMEALLPAPGLAAMESLGLLHAMPGHADQVVATVLLYPTGSLYIVSDREDDPTDPGAKGALLKDSVYPAISTNTGRFLALLPQSPCDALLDLCAGTGIAALVAADHTRRAWAVDITERSTAFARFNADLNGIDNVTALQGDLYEPLDGLTFDRIVAHPPYMPAVQLEFIYRDGGTDGEQVTARILGGLRTYLRPGGRLQCGCLITERRSAAAEERVRGMLGEHQNEFDLLVVTAASSTPAEFYRNMASHGKMPEAKAVQYQHMLEALDVERMVLCTLVVQRHDAERPAFTVRRPEGQEMGPDDIDWLLRWEAAVLDRNFIETLVGARPRLSPRARLHMVSRAKNGSWVPESWAVKTETPFPYGVEAPLDVVGFLASCDGRTTIRQHLDRVRAAGSVPAGTTPRQFVDLLLPLFAAGLLEIEAMPLPPHQRDLPPKPLDKE
jgi:SAM-dependent methyltransferase